MYILVTYDVDTTSTAGRKRLRHVAKACLDYGKRVQNSVFECQISDAQIATLQIRLQEIINQTTDTIRIYFLNKNFPKTITLGIKPQFEFSDPLII